MLNLPPGSAEFWIQARRAVPTPIKDRVNSLRYALHVARFIAAKKIKGFTIDDSPHFCDQGKAAFVDAIQNTETYLEYGSGGSTVFAHGYVTNLISVDSDRDVLKAVEGRLSRRVSSTAKRTALLHANIGLTKEWGYPVFTKRNATRAARWVAYAQAPWAYLHQHKLQPDMILIDGRFRVACVLESLINLQHESRCRIFVDDYLSRPEYSVVERFAELVDMKGRMAALRKRTNLDPQECRLALEQYILDCR
jgi:hypothetical protein